MNEYFDLKCPPTKYDRLIRIYNNKCVFNKKACTVLYNPKNPKIGFRIVELGDKPVRVFIRPDVKDGFYISTRKDRLLSGHINSRKLCEDLAKYLNGFGTYKISEYPQDIDGLSYEILPEKLLG